MRITPLRPPARARARRGLGAAVVLVVGVGMVAATATQASAATGCQVTYQVVNQWPGGFQAGITIKNLGDPVTSWRLGFAFANGQTVQNGWGGVFSQSGSAVTVANEGYNGALGTGGTVSPGFNGVWNGANPAPTAFTLNGVTCGGAAPSSAPPSSTPSGPTPSPTRSTTPSPTPTSSTPPTGTPVSIHGKLHVCGSGMCDEHGAKVQLRGVSSMWLNWESQPYAENLSALRWMRDNWHLQVIRAAMGVEPSGAYLSNPSKARGQVETIINNAAAAGVYVIVDFHADHANQEQSQAVAFFSDLAQRYGNLPNVIWEDWNEPNGANSSWSAVKAYHQAVVPAIRAADPDNIIVLGTPTWSQDVDVAAGSPVSGTNLMYTLHFYSCSHTAWLRSKADTAIRAGLALFVTEWGASNADGGLDGTACYPEAQTWIDWMKANNISWAAWKLDVGTDTTNLLSAGAPVTGGWDNYLHGHASFVVSNMK
ncbi:cellulase family glycosylhydrolase [Plantactinospora siamensis]|uniref:Endoglucanase n=1 Tax=Plantactinospora siamensis TaxID=555372 RepID=A0ABV6P3N3_9ACTN